MIISTNNKTYLLLPSEETINQPLVTPGSAERWSLRSSWWLSKICVWCNNCMIYWFCQNVILIALSRLFNTVKKDTQFVGIRFSLTTLINTQYTNYVNFYDSCQISNYKEKRFLDVLMAASKWRCTSTTKRRRNVVNGSFWSYENVLFKLQQFVSVLLTVFEYILIKILKKKKYTL